MVGKNGAKPDDGWQIDLNAIKAKEIEAFQTALNQLTTEGKLEPFWPWAARIIKRWPYQLSPAEIDSYGELGMLDLRETVSRLGDSFRRYAEGTKPIAEGGDAGNEGRAAGPSEGAG